MTDQKIEKERQLFLQVISTYLLPSPPIYHPQKQFWPTSPSHSTPSQCISKILQPLKSKEYFKTKEDMIGYLSIVISAFFF